LSGNQQLGEFVAANMVAVRLAPPFRWIVVGSPACFGRNGRPGRLAELGPPDGSSRFGPSHRRRAVVGWIKATLLASAFKDLRVLPCAEMLSR